MAFNRMENFNICTGCSYMPTIPGTTPFKMEIQQGNFITQDMVSRLKPGMTANLSIIVARRPDTLKVANSALRVRVPESLLPPPPKAPDGKAAPAAPAPVARWLAAPALSPHAVAGLALRRPCRARRCCFPGRPRLRRSDGAARGRAHAAGAGDQATRA